MILKGVNVKGLTFYPNIEKELQPCNHKYGAIAAVTYCTDQVQEDIFGKEILGFKYNFNLHAFVTPIYNDQDVLDEIYETGLIRYGIYYQTEFWENPVTGVIESIPDFYKTIWSQAAADGDLIDASLVGATKAVNYPNHGQQLFDLTGGKYGYDVINDIYGQVDVLTPVIEYFQNWFKNKFGIYASSGSYGYGRKQPIYIIKDYFLGIRNSVKDAGWDYNFNHEIATYKAESTGVNYMITQEGMTRADAIAQCALILEDAIINNGWYTDFTHWHISYDTEMQEYLEGMLNQINGRDVISLDYGTAVEYQFLRRMVRRIGMYTEGAELVIITDVKNFEGLNLNRIETTLSVEVYLTGTILEGKEITGNCDIRKISTNIFVVEIPYSKKDGFHIVRLREIIIPDYLDFTIPTIISATKVGDTLTVETDKLAKIVVYSVPTGTDLYNASVLSRSGVLSSTHEIDVTGIDFSNIDVYVGAITKNRQSTLSVKYNF